MNSDCSKKETMQRFISFFTSSHRNQSVRLRQHSRNPHRAHGSCCYSSIPLERHIRGPCCRMPRAVHADESPRRHSPVAVPGSGSSVSLPLELHPPSSGTLKCCEHHSAEKNNQQLITTSPSYRDDVVNKSWWNDSKSKYATKISQSINQSINQETDRRIKPRRKKSINQSINRRIER